MLLFMLIYYHLYIIVPQVILALLVDKLTMNFFKLVLSSVINFNNKQFLLEKMIISSYVCKHTDNEMIIGVW